MKQFHYVLGVITSAIKPFFGQSGFFGVITITITFQDGMVVNLKTNPEKSYKIPSEAAL